MIKFEDDGTRLILLYSGFPEWVDQSLRETGNVRISKVFYLRTSHLLPHGPDDDHRRFVIASQKDGYWLITRDLLRIKYDLKISTSIKISRSTFIAYQGISIFRRIDELINEPIVVGGDISGAVPTESFQYLMRSFPTTTEVQHYARARVSRVLSEYFETMTDSERQLAQYLKNRKKRNNLANITRPIHRFSPAHELDLEKFIFLREQISHMLEDSESYSEHDWQMHVSHLFTLMFPQYIAVLEEVKVREHYSKRDRVTNRYIDLALVAANGSLDILEIKKPTVGRVISSRRYRDNHVPLRELSGTIMQVEKYLFYLNKSGHTGEREITNKYRHHLPHGLEIQITNPKAVVLFGRDHELSARELRDFEFARRKYSNIVDIMTYDDLLRRLDTLIGSLEIKKTTDL